MLNGNYLHLGLHRLRGDEEFSHSFEGLCFVFPKGGQGRLVNGAHTQLLAPGDILIIRDGAGCKLATGKGGDFVFLAFCLRPEHLFPLFEGKEIALLEDVLKDFGARKHYSSGTSLAVESHRLVTEVTPNRTLDHRGQLVRIAAAVLTEEFKHAHERSGFVRAEEHIIQIFEKLSSDDILSLSIAELADRFSCSRRHLNRLFHQHLGFSATALKSEMRLLRAASLLRNPNSKVITVAQQCGFNHLGLFNTSFRRRFGVSPGQWRDSGGKVEEKFAVATKPEADSALLASGLRPSIGKVTTMDSQPRVPLGKDGTGNGNGLRNGNHTNRTAPEESQRKPLRIEACLLNKILHPADSQLIA